MTKKDSNKNLIPIIYSSILSIFLVVSILFLTTNNNKSKSNEIVAYYKGGNVTYQDIKSEFNILASKNSDFSNLSFEDLNSNQKKLIIEEFVAKKISSKLAKKIGYDEDQEFKEAVENFKLEFLRKKLYKKIIEEAQNEDNLRKKYNELALEMQSKKDFNISYIKVSDNKKAEKIYNQLINNVQSFEEIAKKESIDQKLANVGGNLGFVYEDSLPIEMRRAVKNILDGNISKPFQIGDNWFIIKFIDERPAKILPFEDAKSALMEAVGLEAVQKFVKQKINDAEIKFN